MWPLTSREVCEILNYHESAILTSETIELEGICTDSRKFDSNLNQLFVAIYGEKFDGHAYLKECFEQGLKCALVDKSSKYLNQLSDEQQKKCILVEDVTEALRVLAAAFRKDFSFPVIGIGGSNGKTTTKEILASFLSYSKRTVTKTQKSENGYLGISFTLLQAAHSKKHAPDALVLEIGIDEIGAMERHVEISQPDLVLLSALGPEHLTGLKTWENAVKEELVLFSNPNSKRVWQLSDPKLQEYFINNLKDEKFLAQLSKDFLVIENSHKNILNDLDISNLQLIFWQIKTIGFDNSEIQIYNQNETLFEGSVPLPGRHNIQNFVLAFGAALHMGLSPAQIFDGFENFAPPPQRSRITRLPFDTILYDDTYNSSPASMQAALSIIGDKDWSTKPKILVLGDMLELEDESNFWHESLFNPLAELKNAHLCLFGSAMYNCYKLLKEAREKQNSCQEKKVLLEWSDSKDEPIQFLEKLQPYLKGSIILVKGSRGMRLERFVQGVENFFS